MDFTLSSRQKEWLDRVHSFMNKHVRPAVPIYKKQDEEGARWKVIPILEELKAKARAEGLWNMFMPPNEHEDDEFRGAGLTNLEYALLSEEMGRISWASEVFNCSAPDTGNMEVLMRYGTKEQKRRWLRPLMDGEIRSAFLMTEPAVASSDATNIETRIEKNGDHYVINGRKWWSSGVGDPRCKIAILMGKTDFNAAKHQQQSQILVPLDTPGIKVEKMLPVFGYDDAPHGHAQVLLENVKVPASSIPARQGPRLRDRAGPSRSGPHPSLHAHHRQGRGGAGEDGQAPVVAHRLRQEDHRALGMGAAHRRGPHRHRDDAASLPQGCRHDGQGRQQDRAARNRHDQGRGPEYGAEDHRPHVIARLTNTAVPKATGKTAVFRNLWFFGGYGWAHRQRPALRRHRCGWQRSELIGILLGCTARLRGHGAAVDIVEFRIGPPLTRRRRSSTGLRPGLPYRHRRYGVPGVVQCAGWRGSPVHFAAAQSTLRKWRRPRGRRWRQMWQNDASDDPSDAMDRNAVANAVQPPLAGAPMVEVDPDVIYFRSRLNLLTDVQVQRLRDPGRRVRVPRRVRSAWLPDPGRTHGHDRLSPAPSGSHRRGRCRYIIDGREVDFEPAVHPHDRNAAISHLLTPPAGATAHLSRPRDQISSVVNGGLLYVRSRKVARHRGDSHGEQHGR